MSYAELYDYCQTLDIPVSRAKLIPKIQQLARRPKPPRIIISGMNPAIIAGFIIWPGLTDHPFVRFGRGEPVILVARDLNNCWRRLVVVKELMHYFDRPLEYVGGEDDFESLIHEFFGPKPERSPAMDSEVSAMWMALGVMCPELIRQDFQRKREAGTITDTQVAQALKLPLAYVPSLFDPNFKQYMTYFCGC